MKDHFQMLTLVSVKMGLQPVTLCVHFGNILQLLHNDFFFKGSFKNSLS